MNAEEGVEIRLEGAAQGLEAFCSRLEELGVLDSVSSFWPCDGQRQPQSPYGWQPGSEMLAIAS